MFTVPVQRALIAAIKDHCRPNYDIYTFNYHLEGPYLQIKVDDETEAAYLKLLFG